MHKTTRTSKKRLRIVLVGTLIAFVLLILRLFHIQIVGSEELKLGALEQWTKSIDIKSNRGIIYDRNGKKLAINTTAYTVWATPAEIKDKEETAMILSEQLDLDEEEVFENVTKNVGVVKIKQWIDREQANELRQQQLMGITIVDDSKRFYPYGNFASYILGFTDIDNNGLYGIERTYDEYLSGIPGKWITTTDATNQQMPYDGETIYDAEDGLSIVLTLDETIQHFAENAANKGLIETQAKNISIIVMEPQTGDILAIANKPDYDPNEPRQPLNEQERLRWEGLSQEELQQEWFDMWRNFALNDIYEPGSTFKIITAAAALEEGSANLDTHYYCNGFIRDIQGHTIKCASWYNPHGSQTFSEAVQNSCNIAFVNMARDLGKEKLHEYVKAFGFGEVSGIELLGEQPGIVRSLDAIKEIDLATLSYGHGIAVTPLQMVNAFSALANGGELIKPRIVKHLVDHEGEIVETFDSDIKRKVISEETSKIMNNILENVVLEGTGSRAYVPGFRVGGKTGTAEKVIDGRYVAGKYVGSFGAIAPVDDPKIAILVIVDEPVGVYYGGSTAGPIAQQVIEDTLNYLEVTPEFTEDELELIDDIVEVPDLRNIVIGEAGRILSELELRYTTEYEDITEESKVIDQYPSPGVEVLKGSIIDLYINKSQ